MVKISLKKMLSLLLISCFIAACGQKGDLVRPSEVKAQEEAKAKQQKTQKQ